MDPVPQNKSPQLNFTPSLITAALILFLIGGTGGFYLGRSSVKSPISPTPTSSPSQVFCTMDAKLCPDGSSVGRVGPKCEFAPCPTTQATPTPNLNSNCCSTDLLQQGYTCVQKCGPPLVRVGDGNPGYSCLSPQEQKNHACPICLSSSTMISTPQGDINVINIEVGTIIWTMNIKGQKIAQPVIKISSVQVPSTHQMVHLVLKDGRELYVSPGHITINGSTVEQLTIGSEYDHSFIVTKELTPYNDSKTYDILPAGDTGFYFANHILIGSTLK